MVHVAAKFWENISMRFRVTVQKLNVTDRQTDRQTDGRGGGGRSYISRPGPSAPREIIKRDGSAFFRTQRYIPNFATSNFYQICFFRWRKPICWPVQSNILIISKGPSIGIKLPATRFFITKSVTVAYTDGWTSHKLNRSTTKQDLKYIISGSIHTYWTVIWSVVTLQ